MPYNNRITLLKESIEVIRRLERSIRSSKNIKRSAPLKIVKDIQMKLKKLESLLAKV